MRTTEGRRRLENTTGRYEHPRQVEMFKKEEDGRVENDTVSDSAAGDSSGNHGAQRDEQTKKAGKGRVSPDEHKFLSKKDLCPRCGLFHISKNHDCMPAHELEDQRCRFCQSGGLQFVHGHYHCPRCGMANLACCDGETA